MLKWFFRGPFIKYSYKLFIKGAKGLKNIPQGKGFIVVANHTSYLDIIALSVVFQIKKKINIRYLAKKELFTNWLFRRLEGIFHGIPIDRSKNKSEEALQLAIKALKKGKVIGMYPEGERSITGKIQKGKTGAIRLALWSKVPVLPVGIMGAFEIMPKGRIIPKFKKNITLNIGKPIYFNKYYNTTMTKKLLRQQTNKIIKEIAKLSGQRYMK